MNVKQAAERLEISPSLVYQLIAEKRLPCLRIGGKGRRGKIVVKEEHIEEFLVQVRIAEEGD